MLHHKHLADLVSKYTFVDDAKVKSNGFYIYYTAKDGQQKHKRLPLRAPVKILQKTLKHIETEI